MPDSDFSVDQIAIQKMKLSHYAQHVSSEDRELCFGDSQGQASHFQAGLNKAQTTIYGRQVSAGGYLSTNEAGQLAQSNALLHYGDGFIGLATLPIDTTHDNLAIRLTPEIVDGLADSKSFLREVYRLIILASVDTDFARRGQTIGQHRPVVESPPKISGFTEIRFGQVDAADDKMATG